MKITALKNLNFVKHVLFENHTFCRSSGVKMLNTMYKGKRMTALEYLKISKVVNDPSHIIVNEIPLFSARYADLYKYKYKQFNLRGTNSIFQPSNEQNQNKKKNTDPIQIES